MLSYVAQASYFACVKGFVQQKLSPVVIFFSFAYIGSLYIHKRWNVVTDL